MEHEPQLKPQTRMILIAAIACVLLYAIVAHLWQPGFDGAPNQKASNEMRIERFVFSEEPIRALVVGSSMADRLPQEALGDEIYKLTIGAQPTITALDLLVRSEHAPEIVFVEVNSWLRASDTTVADSVFSNLNRLTKSEVVATRVEHRPDLLAWGALRTVAGRDSTDRMNERPNRKVLEGVLRTEVEARNDEPELEHLMANIETVHSYVDELEKRDTRVVFFLMPMHPEIIETRSLQALIGHVREAFPRTEYRWINVGPPTEETTDGIHLTYPAAWRSAEMIRDAWELMRTP